MPSHPSDVVSIHPNRTRVFLKQSGGGGGEASRGKAKGKGAFVLAQTKCCRRDVPEAALVCSFQSGDVRDKAALFPKQGISDQTESKLI